VTIKHLVFCIVSRYPNLDTPYYRTGMHNQRPAGIRPPQVLNPALAAG